MKSLKIVGIILASLLVIVGLSIGGYKVMQKVEHDEMARIVKSDEVKKIVENKLKYLDSEALTKEGTIKSYEIDINSIKHNPMGGIDFKVYVNSDKKLRVMYGLEKDSTTGKIEYSGGGYSAQLAELLKKVKKMIQKYTEHDRQKIAAREYTEYTKDDPIDIGTDKNRKNQWKSVSG